MLEHVNRLFATGLRFRKPPPPTCTGRTQPVEDTLSPCPCELGPRSRRPRLGFLEHPNALGGVTSTASCDPPKHGRFWANTSMRRSKETTKHTNTKTHKLVRNTSFWSRFIHAGTCITTIAQRIFMATCTANSFGEAIENQKSHMVEMKCQDRIKKELSICHFLTMSGPGYTRLLQI